MQLPINMPRQADTVDLRHVPFRRYARADGVGDGDFTGDGES